MNSQKTCVLFRHGEYRLTSKGDGLLTKIGKEATKKNARTIAQELKNHEIKIIDKAIVSGSVRGSHTFILLYEVFLKESVLINSIDISRNYYCNRKEENQWIHFHTSKTWNRYLEDRKALGEHAAILKYCKKIAQPCVNRILKAIRATSKRSDVILVITHNPYGALIAEALTGKTHKGLGLSEGKIVQFSDSS